MNAIYLITVQFTQLYVMYLILGSMDYSLWCNSSWKSEDKWPCCIGLYSGNPVYKLEHSA